MKITDKMRLDWVAKKLNRYFYKPGHGAIISDIDGYEWDGRNIREAIDAAIRAGERNKYERRI